MERDKGHIAATTMPGGAPGGQTTARPANEPRAPAPGTAHPTPPHVQAPPGGIATGQPPPTAALDDNHGDAAQGANNKKTKRKLVQGKTWLLRISIPLGDTQDEWTAVHTAVENLKNHLPKGSHVEVKDSKLERIEHRDTAEAMQRSLENAAQS